jgi:hypothetical protein
MSERNLAEWDREIEADFQKTVAGWKRQGRRHRHIGCPFELFTTAVKRTKGHQTALALALYIYRRQQICKDNTVTLVSAELAEMGIDRWSGRKALNKLQAIGLVRLCQAKPGQKRKVTLLWRG